MPITRSIGGILTLSVLTMAAFVGVFLLGRERRRNITTFHRTRPDIPIQEQHHRFYSTYRFDQVAELLTDIAKLYGVRDTALRPEDRFEAELRSLKLSPVDVKYEIICSKYRFKRLQAGKATTSYPVTVRDYITGTLTDDKGTDHIAGKG